MHECNSLFERIAQNNEKKQYAIEIDRVSEIVEAIGNVWARNWWLGNGRKVS